jgi:hypothetical protein
MVRKLAAFAVIGAMIAGPTLAAEASVASLGAVQGSVMVSQNGKMTSGVSALHAGDRVVAKANSSASVKFADGCVVAVKASSMLTVSAKSPCASGAGVVNASQADSNELWGMSPGVEATLAFVVLSAIVIGGRASGELSASP